MNSLNQFTYFPTLSIEIIQILGNQNNNNINYNGEIIENQIQIITNQNYYDDGIVNNFGNNVNQNNNHIINDGSGFSNNVGYSTIDYNVNEEIVFSTPVVKIGTFEEAECLGVMGVCAVDCKRRCQGFVLANKRKTCNCGHSLSSHFVNANGDKGKIEMQHQLIDTFFSVPVAKTKQTKTKQTKTIKTLKTISTSRGAVRNLVSKLNKNGSSSS